MHVLQQLLPLIVWAQAMHPLRSLMHRNAESKQVLRLLALSSFGTTSPSYVLEQLLTLFVDCLWTDSFTLR